MFYKLLAVFPKFQRLNQRGFHQFSGLRSLANSNIKTPKTLQYENPGDLTTSNLIDCRQGEKQQGVFTHAEIENRLNKLRGVMRENELDAVVLTSLHNINYFDQFLYCYFGRSYGLVVTLDDTETTTITPGIDYGQPWRRGHSNNLTYSDWQSDNYYKAVKHLIGDNKRIGLEFDHLTLDRYDKFTSGFPGVKFKDIGKDAMKLRMVKSAEEIKLVKEGARIADIGGWAVVEALKENIPEHEVALHSTRAMIREIAATYPNSDIMDTWTWFQSGINTDGAHNPVTTRPVQNGDISIFNCFPMISGNYAALERILFLNHASDEHIRIWNIIVEVHKKGIELVKPGIKCSEISSELNEIFKLHNVLQYRTIGYGHSFGTLCHYYGREAGLEIREDNDTVIQPNMVISMEPMLTIPEGMPGSGGYREHDILVVTENGAEDITKFPFGPEYNIIKK